jgi:hypothetical protein
VKRKVGKGENRTGALRKIRGKITVCREFENKSPLTSHEGRENVSTDRAYKSCMSIVVTERYR